MINQQHVRAVAIQIEPICHIVAQYGWCKRTEALAELHFEVQRLLHGFRARIAQDRPTAQRARAEFHATIEPTDSLAICEALCRGLDHFFLIKCGELCTHICQALFNIRCFVDWAKIAALHGIPRRRINRALLTEFLVIGGVSSTKSTTRITSSRLNPQVLERAVAQDDPVSHTVQCNTTRHTQVRNTVFLSQ